MKATISKAAVTIVLTLLLTLEYSTSLKLPNYIKPCSKNDPKLNECALKNGREAIPKIIKGDAKYRIPSLEPLEVDEIIVGEGSQGNIGLKLSCKKCKFYGLEKVKLEDVKIDLNKKHIQIDVSCPKIQIAGKYKASGKVLILPITGDGDADINLKDVKLRYISDFELVKKGGKDHIKLVKPKLEVETEGMTFKLTNLFNGDKVLGEQMNTFLNENWREVLKEFGPAVINVLSEVFTVIVNNITDLVSYEDIFSS
ncbi:protein takeout-like [Lycorma delicatula]|uniref:protein takeout-like n=1 Tax=Lycorma delicatula TaxID=130591 RepID=UPI003F513AD3